MVMPNYTGEGSTSLTMGPGELNIFVDSTKKYSFRFLLLDILLKRYSPHHNQNQSGPEIIHSYVSSI